MAKLQRDGSVCILRWLVQVGTSLRVNSCIRQWLSQWRSRASKVWGAGDPPAHDEQYEHDPDAGVGAGVHDNIDAADIVDLLNTVLQANPEDAQSVANLSRLNVVQSLWREGAPHTGGAPLVLADTSLRTDSHADLQRLHKLLSDIRKGTATLVGSPERLPGPSGGSAPCSNIRDLLSQGANLQGFTDDLLNSEQNAALRVCLEFLRQTIRHEQDAAHHAAPVFT